MNIPTYGAPKVDRSPLPGVRVDANAPSAAFGVPAVIDPSGVAAIVTKRAQEEADFADQSVVNAAERQLADHRSQLMAAAMDQKGHNAVGSSEAVQKAWQDRVDEILGSLRSDRQKQAVQQRANSYWANLYENVESHAHAESRKADTDDYKALIDSDLSQVEQAPSMAVHTAEMARARVKDYGRSQGWGDAQIEQEQAARVSDVHYAALKTLLSDDSPASADMASSYFKEFGNQLQGQQKAIVEKAIAKAENQAIGDRAASGILKAHPTFAGAVQAAEAIEDTGARDIALKEIERHFTLKDRAEHSDRQNALARLLPKLEASHGRLPAGDPDLQLIQGHPEGEQLLHRQDQLLRPPKDPGDPESFMAHLNLASISPASREQFVGMNFMGKDGEGLNVAQRTHLIQLQAQYRGQDVRHDETELRKAEQHATQAESLRFQRETALLKVGDPSHTNTYIADKEQRDAEVSRIKAHFDALERAHAATAPAPQTQATPQMLEGAGRNPAYAAYLRSMGVKLPKVLPKPAEPKK